jgi:hypothetical protein
LATFSLLSLGQLIDHDHALCKINYYINNVHVDVAIHFRYCVCFNERKRSCACFLIVDICLAVGYPITKRGRVGISFIGLTPLYCCSCPNPGPWSATWRRDFVLLILSVLWWQVIVRFVDIGGIVYHHCLHVLLILVELFTIIVYTFCWYWWNFLPSLFTRFVDIGGIVYNHCLHVLLILVELFTIIVYTFCWYW